MRRTTPVPVYDLTAVVDGYVNGAGSRSNRPQLRGYSEVVDLEFSDCIYDSETIVVDSDSIMSDSGRSPRSSVETLASERSQLLEILSVLENAVRHLGYQPSTHSATVRSRRRKRMATANRILATIPVKKLKSSEEASSI